jgi:Zn-dependent protease with chaperone function
MSYENPQVPHEVNVSRESVPAEFVRLAVGLGIAIVVVTGLLYFGGGALARLIPFRTEAGWVEERVLAPLEITDRSADARAAGPYLQRLADDLALGMALPAGMRPIVHWSETDVPNAFATLGGHIIVTRGLYTRMPSENALAMVVAHEIAHVRERDPISAVGGSATLVLALVLLGGDVDRLVPHLAQAVQLGYSRRAERRADERALLAVMKRYGHAGGTAAVFEALERYAVPARDATPTLLSTHPADEDRIARLRAAAREWDPVRLPLRPLEVTLERRKQGAAARAGTEAPAAPRAVLHTGRQSHGACPTVRRPSSAPRPCPSSPS